MHLSDQLQEKWKPVIEHPDLPEIKDSYKKAVTAMLLENQEKAAREEHAMLNEVNVVGAGNVALTLDKLSYEDTDLETLTANPATHWEFDSWGDDLSGSTNPETLLMDADKTVTANFTVEPSFDYGFGFDSDHRAFGSARQTGQAYRRGARARGAGQA